MKMSKTVFGRLIFLFIVLILPLTIVSIVLLLQSNAKITQSTLDRMNQDQAAFVSKLEDSFLNTYEVAVLSKVLDKANKLALQKDTLDSYDKIRTVVEITEKLDMIKIVDNSVDNAKVYIEPLGQIYNASVYKKGSVQPLTAEEFQSVKENAAKPYLLQKGEEGLSLFLGTVSEHTVALLEIAFSQPKLKKELDRSVAFPGVSQYILIHPQEEYFFSNMRDIDFSSAVLETLPNRATSSIVPIQYNGQRYYVFHHPMKSLQMNYTEIIPAKSIFKPLQLSTAITGIFVIVVVAIIALFLIGAYYIIHKPLANLTHAFDGIKQGDLTARAKTPETEDFAYLYQEFNEMAETLEVLVKESYQKEILLQTAELRQLQAQINPHFLYNSFFMLQRVIASGDLEQAEDISSKLGIYFRYIVRSNSDIVSLKDEVNHARIYADIQASRFAGRITVAFDELPEPYQDMLVPKLFLQPLIENAFHHGLENKLTGGRLQIKFFSTPQGLRILVEDNGADLTEEGLQELKETLASLDTIDVTTALGSLSGLFNIAKRFELFYNNPSSVTLARSSIGGLAVEIILPTGEEEGAARV